MFEWFIESNKKTAISTGKLLNETGIAGCANDFMRIRVAFSVDSLESVSNTVQNWTTNSSHKVIEIEDKLLIKTIYRKSGEITAFEDKTICVLGRADVRSQKEICWEPQQLNSSDLLSVEFLIYFWLICSVSVIGKSIDIESENDLVRNSE